MLLQNVGGQTRCIFGDVQITGKYLSRKTRKDPGKELLEQKWIIKLRFSYRKE